MFNFIYIFFQDFLQALIAFSFFKTKAKLRYESGESISELK